MNNLFRNSEIKVIFFSILIIQTIFATLVFVYFKYEMNTVKIQLIEQNFELVGKILSLEPSLSSKIEQTISDKNAIQDKEIGEKALKKLGYDKSLDIKYMTNFRDILNMIPIKVLIFIFLGTIPLFLVIIWQLKKLYGKAKNCALLAEKVSEGNFDIVDINLESEGEFGLLAHMFHKMKGRLNHTLSQLNNEKIYLKNTISDISHQLKTPLTTLITFNDLMLNEPNMEQTQRESFLTKNKTNLYRMEWLIQGLLKVARLEAGVIRFNKEQVWLKECSFGAIETLGSMIEEKNINIVHKGKDIAINADDAWVTEALTNIIKNSIEHSKNSGKIDIITEETSLLSTIKIIDNGEGIDEKDLPHIFERFYKASKGSKPSSIGIGLSLAKIIIEGNGGTIHVKSEKGIGSEFEICFLKYVV